MPTCNTESLTRMWLSNESLSSGSTSSGFYSPGSPSSQLSLSPISTSPDNTLKRHRIRRTSSAGSVIHEPFVIQSDCRDSRSQSPIHFQEAHAEETSPWISLIGWYPWFLVRMIRVIFLAVFPQTWKQLIFAVPMFWFSVWSWIFWQVILLPLNIFKMIFRMIFVDPQELNRKKRTILISGGSTVQSLHLARNLHSAGARVIVCEIEGHFPLTRFSTAVSKFYTVPKPTSDHLQNYVRALCEIVDKEGVSYYIPVSSTTSAYYDAVAKPHLELLGCTCISPGIKEVWALDDTLEVLKVCEKLNLPTPNCYTVKSKQDVYNLYDAGVIKRGKHVMTNTGPLGLRERSNIDLPLSRSELKLTADISEKRPWVVVEDIEGEHFVTCTTVKESKVIANVTCKMDKSNNLTPIESKEITGWLNNFFNKINLLRPITCHISFRFAIKPDTKTLIPLSSRVGISLPYICYTSVHPKLLWKPCRHFSRQNSGPLVNQNPAYWMPEALLETLRNPSVDAVTRLIGTVLDKREAIFEIWDPLPYCAYYHMQLPYENLMGFVRRKGVCLTEQANAQTAF